MVWCIGEPKRFGEFFLDGNYVGFKEQLKESLQNHVSQGDQEKYGIAMLPSYGLHVSFKFTGITSHEIDHPRAMPPLMDYEQPQIFAIEQEHSKAFGSLVKLTDRLLAVDEQLKTIIEVLEPGIHQFWPVEILAKNRTSIAKRYYGMRVRQFLDSFVPDQTPPKAVTDETGSYYACSPTKQGCKDLAISRTAIGSTHLWRERKLKNPNLLLSNELAHRIKNNDLRVPNLFKLSEVD